MPKAPPSAFRNVVEEHRARLNRLIDRRGVAQLKKLYDAAADVLERRLAGTIGRPTDSFTSTQQRSLLAQVKAGQADISRRLSRALGEATLDAQTESLRTLITNVERLDKKFLGASTRLPLEEAARFRGVIDRRRSSLLRAHDTSMARFGARAIQKIEEALSLSLATGETGGQAIDRVRQQTDIEWYQGERIVRTEVAWAYNATHADGIAAARNELPDMMMRWSEHVDDATYEPLDDRVSVDSIAMHGQLAAPGGAFTMPPTAPKSGAEGTTIVPSALVGQRWTHPPNRPNDRAVLAPWRPDWGVPGWIWRGGRRVPVRT